MPGSYVEPPYGLLWFGIFLLLLAVAGTCTGEALTPYGGRVVHRAKEPKEFWWSIAMCYLGGVCLVGYFLYKVYLR